MIGIVIDIVLGVVLIAALVVGATKGFAKLFSSFASTVGTLVVSLVLAGYVASMMMQASFSYAWVLGVANWFSEIQGAATVVRSAEQLSTALSSGPLSIFSSYSQQIFETMNANALDTIGAYFGFLILQAAFAAVIFVVLYLFFVNLFKGVRFILVKLSKCTGFHAIDKVFGVAWAIVMTYIVLIGGVLTLLEMVLGIYFPNLLDPILVIISKSTLLSFAHTTNFVGAIISQMFGYTLPPLPIVP